MNKIGAAFKDGKALIAYLMAGDPDLETSAEYILAAQQAGADMVEIGIPFSDPIAEGGEVEAANFRALDTGTRLDSVFEMVASIKNEMRIPLVFMTYLNPVFVYGYDRFFARCAQIGVAGIIIPDMPFEEQGEVRQVAERHGVEVGTLIAPASPERTAKIAGQAQGFIYLISPISDREQAAAGLTEMVAQVRQVTDIPIAIDCGHCPEQAGLCSAIADGVVVGSAIVSVVGRYGKGATQPLCDCIKMVKESMAP